MNTFEAQATRPAAEGRRPRTTETSTPTWFEGYVAGLALGAPFMPGVAAVVSIAAFLLLPLPDGGLAQLGIPAVALGLGVTAAVWLVLGVPLRSVASAENALPRVYGELLGRYDELLRRKDALRNVEGAEALAAGHSGAYRQIEDVLAFVEFELFDGGKRPALKWALGYGYTNALRELHRGGEYLLLIDTPEEVVGDAIEDELALEGSTIANRERLRSILRAAIARISPGGAATFLPEDPGTTRDVANVPIDDAREAIRKVDHAIKDFRDRAREELVRSRNNLMWAMLSLAATAYALLGLAFVRGASRDQIAAAAAFVFAGAVVGLFHRVNIDAGRDAAVEDFGLYQARLVASPVISGLAAVAGVYLMAAAPGLSISAGSAPPLSTIFNLTDSSHVGLVYAAIFGLTPGALTGRLEKQTRKMEEDLQASSTATAGAA